MKYNTPWAYVRNDDCSINNSPIFFMPIKIIFDVHCLSGALIYNAIWHILKIICVMVDTVLALFLMP